MCIRHQAGMLGSEGDNFDTSLTNVCVIGVLWALSQE